MTNRPSSAGIRPLTKRAPLDGKWEGWSAVDTSVKGNSE